jgi:hypothetical protein
MENELGKDVVFEGAIPGRVGNDLDRKSVQVIILWAIYSWAIMAGLILFVDWGVRRQ